MVNLYVSCLITSKIFLSLLHTIWRLYVLGLTGIGFMSIFNSRTKQRKIWLTMIIFLLIWAEREVKVIMILTLEWWKTHKEQPLLPINKLLREILQEEAPLEVLCLINLNKKYLNLKFWKNLKWAISMKMIKLEIKEAYLVMKMTNLEA